MRKQHTYLTRSLKKKTGNTHERETENLGSKGGRSYSTPFVLLTDTFKGKLLCCENGGRGHQFRNVMLHINTIFISSGRRKIFPHMGIDIMLYDTLSREVHHTQIELRICKPLFGSESIPLHRSLIVLWNTISFAVHPTQIVLGFGKSLLMPIDMLDRSDTNAADGKARLQRASLGKTGDEFVKSVQKKVS